jgi:hypothetical protein
VTAPWRKTIEQIAEPSDRSHDLTQLLPFLAPQFSVSEYLPWRVGAAGSLKLGRLRAGLLPNPLLQRSVELIKRASAAEAKCKYAGASPLGRCGYDLMVSDGM